MPFARRSAFVSWQRAGRELNLAIGIYFFVDGAAAAERFVIL